MTIAHRIPDPKDVEQVSRRAGPTTAVSRTSWILLMAGVFSVTWIGFRVTTNTTPSDILLILSVVALGPSTLFTLLARLPSVVLVPAYVLLLLEVFGMRDTPSQYMGLRTAAALLLCVLATSAHAHDAIQRRILTSAFVFGAAVSATFALVSIAGGWSFRLAGVTQFPGRETGFTPHPNHLGLTCLLGFSAALFGSVGRSQRTRTALRLILLGGVLVSGSRAALIGALVMLLISTRQARLDRRNYHLAAVAAWLGALVVVFAPWLGRRISGISRLFPADTAASGVAQSNEGRLDLAMESIAEFRGSPIIGVGLNRLRESHNLYLQLLMCGGIVLLLSFAPLAHRVLAVGGLTRRRLDPNVAGFVAWLVAGLFMNAIFDRYLYVLPALALSGRYWAGGREVQRSSDA